MKGKKMVSMLTEVIRRATGVDVYVKKEARDAQRFAEMKAAAERLGHVRCDCATIHREE